MRRRITLAILAVAVAALAVAGFGTLFLMHRTAVSQARDRLQAQAQAIADNLDTFLVGRSANARKDVLSIVTKAASLQGTAIAVVEPNGTLTPLEPTQPLLGLGGSPRPLPSGLSSAELQPAALEANRSVTGTSGALVFAAVPAKLDVESLIPAAGATAAQTARFNALRREVLGVAPGGSLPLAVIVTGSVTGAPHATYYFVLAGLAALAVALVVGDRLSGRVTRPLARVEATARRIAEGDLAARAEGNRRDDREVESLAASINTMADSLQAGRRQERQFFLSVSHDLRTPLTSIRGWSEAIADGAVSEPRRAAEIIGAEARRMERLVEDLLAMGRLDSPGFSLATRPTDVAEVVADTAESFRPLTEAAGLGLQVDVPTGPVLAEADPDRLAQVVANLVENAYKFAFGRITVTVAPGPGAHGAVVQVVDDGPGIPPDDLPHVFERLYQSLRTPARQAGSGLGLAIVKELTTAMGATVAATTPAGGGTRMTVTLRPASDGAG